MSESNNIHKIGDIWTMIAVLKEAKSINSTAEADSPLIDTNKIVDVINSMINQVGSESERLAVNVVNYSNSQDVE